MGREIIKKNSKKRIASLRDDEISVLLSRRRLHRLARFRFASSGVETSGFISYPYCVVCTGRAYNIIVISYGLNKLSNNRRTQSRYECGLINKAYSRVTEQPVNGQLSLIKTHA